MPVKKTKICPKCSSSFTKKIGKQNNIQRYKCNACSKKFSSKRRVLKLSEIIFRKYVFKHQTQTDLALEYNRSKDGFILKFTIIKYPINVITLER